MKILLKSGKIIDPESKKSRIADVLIESGKIKKISGRINTKARVIDAAGMIVSPGFIDLHTHLREPGNESKETITSGTLAAARGGYTTVCAMPNTDPPIDTASGVKYILTTCAQEGNIRVLSIGAITKERKGSELTEIGKMTKAGIVGISDDGTSVMNSLVMRRAMEYSKMFGLIIISHCEDLELSKNGMMNEGKISTIMGLRGIPTQAEEIMVARDISLAELTGCHLHLAHITTRRSIALIKEAKKRKINVTAEVTPHHLVLTEEDVIDYNTNCKVNPPLRTRGDRAALISALRSGIIDCIATDHAPHLDQEKNQEFDLAPFGINGLETAFPALFTNLVDRKQLTLAELIEKLTIRPANILKRSDIGRIREGANADITVIDLNKKIDVGDDFFLSRSKNSPFIGKTLKGFPVLTIYNGRIAWHDKEYIK
ncbi:MAG: dihydroorotase [Elusimicrobia bacterium]|nr:dihydroorotase [Elusimicrobiota bacterium]